MTAEEMIIKKNRELGNWSYKTYREYFFENLEEYQRAKDVYWTQMAINQKSPLDFSSPRYLKLSEDDLILFYKFHRFVNEKIEFPTG